MISKGRWVNALSITLGIAGLLLSYYFYRASQLHREPVFMVDEERTEIVRAATVREAPIRVLTRSGQEITADLYSVRVYMWNAGTIPIRPEHVLEQLTIQFDDSTVVLMDHRILRASRSLSAITLEPESLSGATASLRLNFRILEPNDGFVAQLTYTGPRDARIHLKGAIEGVISIAAAPTGRTLSRIAGTAGTLLGAVILATLTLLGSILLIAYFGSKLEKLAARVPVSALVGVMLALFLGLFVLLGHKIYDSSYRSTPTRDLPSPLRSDSLQGQKRG